MENTSTATLTEGTELSVALVDGSTETVRVRKLPIEEYPQYLRSMGDESAQAELLCGKPAGWAAELTRESREAVIDAGDDLNADFFSRWIQSDAAQQALASLAAPAAKWAIPHSQ